jgi:glycosyltransferase involved in cell wall biosynthesis
MKTPLLLISDAPSAPSGLARICRDLATGIHYNLSDIFEVATLGYKGNGDRRLPFLQYNMEGLDNWFIPGIKDVWDNFSEGRRGAILCIWDSSRLLWLARPDQKIHTPDKEIQKWLMSKPFEKWIYAPMDAEGPNGQLCCSDAESMYGFDRIIAYSEWAKNTIEATFSEDQCKERDLVAIPHGIHTGVFHSHHEKERGEVFRNELQYTGAPFQNDEKIIGIVATNQARKDYGMAIAALAEVAKDIPIRIFIQIDTPDLHWSIGKLLVDYKLIHRSMVNFGLVSDEVMAKLYSACDLTLGIGPEGFGYPIFESLACGTPVVAGSFGGHAEHMDPDYLQRPELFRIEGTINSVRPVFDPKKWAYRITKHLKRMDGNPYRKKSLLPERLEWKNLWAAEWEPWFRRQHQRFESSEPIPVLPSNTPETGTEQEAHHT